ncbi:membrane-bound lytic murein transglycosylase A [Thalassobaculum fulvum]|uniref:peptidoglycan lytic exotransglycosylase n=1 Tax=Thalassobaculum fulvum TaxID=1633335 RepID=A0A918XMV2_9PROT|nr:MltA domain-containing protein [Thalassobaculum fulvum]GHD39714.1 membrane-bound lytic murein transglycosylase A [Thalassobaculum fulvum]
MFPRTEPRGSGRRGTAAAALLAVALLLSACGREPTPEAAERLIVEPASVADLPGWEQDDPRPALAAFRRTCGPILRGDQSRAVGPDGRFGTRADWAPVCRAGEAVDANDPDAVRRFFAGAFTVWRARDDKPEDDLFTGYFEPELAGSLRKAAGYPVTLYKRPPDLIDVDLGAFRESLKGERIAGRVENGRLVPYADRAAIEDGGIAGKAEPLLYLADPVDAFFLHIQGSGLVILPDGSRLRVGYDGTNGHPYYAIGRWLIAEGEVPKEKMSLQAIRDWLAAHPERRRELMDRNPSYVFFRRLTGDGPVGAAGVALTPGRSLAVDRRHLPLGAPLWVDVAYPTDAGPALRRLMIAQDTGGAIRGPVRADVFWGAGKPAEALAGPMAAKGRYWLLLPNGVDPNRKG